MKILNPNINIGETFNRLTIICIEPKQDGKTMVKCACDCGSVITHSYYQIAWGHKKSCGCINRSFSANKTINGKAVGNSSIHGMANTRIYSIWKNMKERCRNKNKSNYKYYGGRGISVCDKWINSFKNFYEDMGDPTTNKHSIDRINTNGNYEPNNCKWSTQSEQCINKRPIERI